MTKIKIGDYSLFKLYQEQKLDEDKAMLKGLNDTVLHHWTRDQKDWVLRHLNNQLESEFRLTENSILSIKEWEEAKTKEQKNNGEIGIMTDSQYMNTGAELGAKSPLQDYEEWLANNPKYEKVGTHPNGWPTFEKEGA